jgi:hypothetical protein
MKRKGKNMNRQNIQTIANDLRIASGYVVPPINVVKIARHLGVKVYGEELPEDISGILDERNEPVIFRGCSKIYSCFERFTNC